MMRTVVDTAIYACNVLFATVAYGCRCSVDSRNRTTFCIHCNIRQVGRPPRNRRDFSNETLNQYREEQEGIHHYGTVSCEMSS